MAYERPTSHLIPRTPDGKIITAAWVVVFLLAMPPITHSVLDRPDRWVMGLPLFFVALLVIYSVLVGILLWALRRDV